MGVSSCLLRAGRASGMCRDSASPLSFLIGSLESAHCKPCWIDQSRGCFLVAAVGTPYPRGSGGFQESLM